MSYTSRTFSDGDTLTASNMNEIKDEISELYSKSNGYVFDSSYTLSDFQAAITDLSTSNNICNVFITGSNLMLALTNNATSTSAQGIAMRITSSIVDYTLVRASAGIIYIGRINNGAVTYVFSLTGTSLS